MFINFVGELENTFATTFCRASNLMAYIRDTPLDIIRRLGEAIPSARSREGKTTDFHNLLGEHSFSHEFDEFLQRRLKAKPNASLDKLTHDLFVQYLNTHCSDCKSVFVTKGNSLNKIQVTPSIWSLEKVFFSGFWYRPVYPRQSVPSPNEPFSPHADSHVLIKTSTDVELLPCCIQEIFAHKRGDPHTKKPIIEMFLVVRRYVELGSEDLKFDFWRKYITGGGRLYYDVFSEEPHIVKVVDIVSHFAKTPLTGEDIPGLSRQCIHVLPLNWVIIFFFSRKMHAIILFIIA
jgi:hypothetical protein